MEGPCSPSSLSYTNAVSVYTNTRYGNQHVFMLVHPKWQNDIQPHAPDIPLHCEEQVQALQAQRFYSVPVLTYGQYGNTMCLSSCSKPHSLPNYLGSRYGLRCPYVHRVQIYVPWNLMNRDMIRIPRSSGKRWHTLAWVVFWSDIAAVADAD